MPNSYASASLKCQSVTLAVGFKLAFVEIGAYIDLHIDNLSIEKKHEEDELGEKCPILELVPLAGVELVRPAMPNVPSRWCC